MRFLLDQSSDARLVDHLRGLGHVATRIGRDHPGRLKDADVLSIAYREKRILITDDRDFGELVFRHRQPHAGVIFLRLGDYIPLAARVDRVDYVLAHFSDQLDGFLVVEPQRIRVSRQ